MRAMGSSTDGTTAPGLPDAPAQPGSQVQSPTADALAKQQQQQEEQQVKSPSSAAAAEADAEQFKYHQQMLYPTPGLRNYGFETDFMLYRFKVKGMMGWVVGCGTQQQHVELSSLTISACACALQPSVGWWVVTRPTEANTVAGRNITFRPTHQVP